MDLSRYRGVGDLAAGDLTTAYRQLHLELQRLCAVPAKDMVAIDAVIVALDEVHASIKDAHKRGADPQRF